MTEIFNLYNSLFKYLDEHILWTNRVVFVSFLLIFLLKLMRLQYTYKYVVTFLIFFTLVVNILRFNPVMEDLTIDYNISIKKLTITEFFSHNNFQGLVYITKPISKNNINELGSNYKFISEKTISIYSENREDWDFPNPKFVNSLSDLLKNFNQFSCDIESAKPGYLNIKITDNSNTYSYCFNDYE